MTDDTGFVQDFIDKARDASQQNVVPMLTKGKYVIRDTLVVNQSMGLRLVGGGGQNRSPDPGWDPHRCTTILQWEGPPNKPIMVMIGCTGLVMEGINFSGKASHGIIVRDGPGSLSLTFRNMGFVGQAVGIQWGMDKHESTCANVTYEDVTFENMGECGVRLMNRQSLQHLFIRPLFTWSPVAIDVQHGGNITAIGGGTFEIGEFLRLGEVASNTRGFRFESIRFDGQHTRTAWVSFADTDRERTYGQVTFANCTQNNGQKRSMLPLLTAAPGCRVIAEHCSFAGGFFEWAEVYGNSRAHGELIVRECDGISGNQLTGLVQGKGGGYWAFDRCGSLYSDPKSISTFPGE